MYEDTIVAQATPPGTGALAIVRLSGPEAIPIADACVRLRKPLAELGSQRCRFGELFDGNELLDQVVVTLFRAPRSYTGEDMVEMTCHGGPYVTTRLVAILQRQGARPAREGEFTLRAYLNGKMDLAQAEAIAALIAARSAAGARAAMRILSGSLRASLEEVLSDLTGVMAVLEAHLDLEEDAAPDVLMSDPADGDGGSGRRSSGDRERESGRRSSGDREPTDGGSINGSRLEDRHPRHAFEPRVKAVDHILQKLQALARSGCAGRMLEEGIRIALVGRPNAGKSSLFNAFLARDRAIVSCEAGTTRDALEAWVEWEGLPISLLDTAGLDEPEPATARPDERELDMGGADEPELDTAGAAADGPDEAESERARSVIEQEGQRRTRDALASATLVVLVVDASRASPEDVSTQLAELQRGLRKDDQSGAAQNSGLRTAPHTAPRTTSNFEPDLGSDATPDAASEFGSDATSDAASDLAADAASDLAADTMPDLALDARQGVASDVTPDAASATGMGDIVVALHKWDLGPHPDWQRLVDAAGRAGEPTTDDSVKISGADVSGAPATGDRCASTRDPFAIMWDPSAITRDPSAIMRVSPGVARIPSRIAVVPSSVVAATGTCALREQLMGRLRAGAGDPAQALLVGDRQRGLVEEAIGSLRLAQSMIKAGEGEELIACELRAAIDAVGELLGRRAGPLILEEIFSRFCVGK